MGHTVYQFINIVIYQLILLIIIIIIIIIIIYVHIHIYTIYIHTYIYIYIYYFLIKYMKSQWGILSNFLLLKSKGVKMILKEHSTF